MESICATSRPLVTQPLNLAWTEIYEYDLNFMNQIFTSDLKQSLLWSSFFFYMDLIKKEYGFRAKFLAFIIVFLSERHFYRTDIKELPSPSSPFPPFSSEETASYLRAKYVCTLLACLFHKLFHELAFYMHCTWSCCFH